MKISSVRYLFSILFVIERGLSTESHVQNVTAESAYIFRHYLQYHNSLVRDKRREERLIRLEKRERARGQKKGKKRKNEVRKNSGLKDN